MIEKTPEEIAADKALHIKQLGEYTQSIIAITVTVATMVAGIYSMLYNVAIPTIISVAFGTVTGFYFSSRLTNGWKPPNHG